MLEHEQLESAIAEAFTAPNVVACASGTASLHLALESLELPLASSVVTSDYNMVAVPRAIAMAGMVPVFADCGDDLLMDLVATKALCKGFPSAILVVHVYGRRVNMDRVHAIAKSREIVVVEDMAELHGVPPHPLTHAACWSFYKNKVVAGEEGGAVSFRNPKHAAVARELRCLGFGSDHNYMHRPRGHNYRMSPSHANLILKSLDHYEDNLATRRDMEERYDFLCPAEWRMPARQSPWVYDLRIPGMGKKRQEEVVRLLNAEGIHARQGFKPMTWQPEFKRCYRQGTGPTDDEGVKAMMSCGSANEVVYLPLTPSLFKSETDREWIAKRSFEILRG